MSELSTILAQSVERLFADLHKSDPADPSAWQAVVDMGLPDLMLPEEAGGMNGTWSDAEPVFRAIGYHALPLPIGETIIGRRLLREAGIEVPDVPLALARSLGGILADGLFSGEVVALSSMPRGSRILVNMGDRMALLDTACAAVRTARSNIAGEDRNVLTFDAAPCRIVEGVEGIVLLRLGAFLRTAQIGGALAACLELSLRYAQERKQFGRELHKFQAIQHQLAQLAEESAAVLSASASAAQALDAGDAGFEVACAKLRANMATGQAALIAHQVHGAIGITKEYDLHRYTNRLWAWRSEFGNDRCWAAELGRTVLSGPAASPWHLLTNRRTT